MKGSDYFCHIHIKKMCLIVMICWLTQAMMSQNRIVDSCKQIIEGNNPDTAKIDAWYKIGLSSEGDAQKTALKNGITIAEKVSDYRRISKGNGYLESYFERMGLKDSVYFSVLNRISLGKRVKDYQIIGHAYTSLFFILSVYYNKQDVTYLDTAIIALRKDPDKRSLVTTLLRKMEFFRTTNSPAGSKEVMKELEEVEKNKTQNLDYLAAKATYYELQNQMDSAIVMTLAISERYQALNNYRFVSYVSSQLARMYCQIKDFKNAKKYSSMGIKLAGEKGYNKEMVDNLSCLYTIYLMEENYKEALKISDRISAFKDSVNTSDIEKVKSSYDKHLKEELLMKDIELNESTVRHQRLILILAFAGLILVVLFLAYTVKKWRESKIKNEIITVQKALVEQKNKEITDSIEYALRIQKAMLPPQKLVKQYLEDSFVLYRPKDIVAGDFYWMHTFEDSVLFAACDCTGHGVPGAMVSVVCHNALERVVKEYKLVKPSDILNKTAELVAENFSKSGENIRDGMDVSMCLLNTQTLELQWAGANNPLWLVSNGQLLETKANKQPIGINEITSAYTHHTFQLKKNDSIYIFSDGYADQFGGESGQKKLTKKRFKELLLSLQEKDMPMQGGALEDFIVSYQKNLEQIDDILIIGVRV